MPEHGCARGVKARGRIEQRELAKLNRDWDSITHVEEGRFSALGLSGHAGQEHGWQGLRVNLIFMHMRSLEALHRNYESASQSWH